jgi:uncharacterized membrane protein YuzA (DUF378 family)
MDLNIDILGVVFLDFVTKTFGFSIIQREASSDIPIVIDG